MLLQGINKGMKQRPISVLYFSNELVRGGTEEHVLTLLRGLDRKRFRLHLVCPPELVAKLQPDLPADVELVPLCLRKPSQMAAALRLAGILRRRRVDILHSHAFYSSLFASPIGWMCRVPVILETSHMREKWRRGWFRSRFVVDRLVGHCVDRYIAVSEATARYLREQKGLPAQKIVVIRNGSDCQRFNPAHSAPSGLKRSLGSVPAIRYWSWWAGCTLRKGIVCCSRPCPRCVVSFPRCVWSVWVRESCGGICNSRCARWPRKTPCVSLAINPTWRTGWRSRT